MTDKRKNALIIFLSSTVLILIISLVVTIYSNDKSSLQETDYQSYQERIDLLISQLQEERSSSDENKVLIENVSRNFLKAYFSVQNSKSQASSLQASKVYITQSLYNRLSPGEPGTEYSDNEIDIEYSSNIIIHKVYYSVLDLDQIVISCTINKTVNDIKSSNDYYVDLTVSNINNEWLIDDFRLISVQGG